MNATSDYDILEHLSGIQHLLYYSWAFSWRCGHQSAIFNTCRGSTRGIIFSKLHFRGSCFLEDLDDFSYSNHCWKLNPSSLHLIEIDWNCIAPSQLKLEGSITIIGWFFDKVIASFTSLLINRHWFLDKSKSFYMTASMMH